MLSEVTLLWCSCQASAKHFQQCAEFLPLRNRGLGPLRRDGIAHCAPQEGRRYLLRRRNVGARSGAIIVAVSLLTVSNGVKRGRDEPTRRARAPGSTLVRQAQDRSRDHPRGTARTGRIPRASSATAAERYAGDTR